MLSTRRLGDVAQLARHIERDPLLGCPHAFDRHVEALAQRFDHLVDQNLRCRRAGRDADRAHGAEPVPGNFRGALHQQRPRASRTLGHLDEAQRVRAVRRTDDDDAVRARCDRLDGGLPVGRRVADVLLVRADDRREPLLEDAHDLSGVVDRQRRLGDEGEVGRIARLEPTRIGDRLDQRHRALGQLPHGPDHLRMAGMPDQHDVEALGVVPLGFDVHFRDQRAGGVEKEHPAGLGRRRHRFRHSMC